MKQPIEVEFDPSNSCYYVWVALVYDHDISRDNASEKHLDHMAFTTRGAAMSFYSPHGDPDGWKVEKENGSNVDVLDLLPGNPWNAYRLELHQLLFLER